MKYKIGKYLYDKFDIIFIVYTLLYVLISFITESIIFLPIYIIITIVYSYWHMRCFEKGTYDNINRLKSSQGPHCKPGKDCVLTEDDKNQIVELVIDKLNNAVIYDIEAETVPDSEKIYHYLRIKKPKLPSKGDEIWFITNDLKIDHMIVDDPEEAVKNILNGCCFYKSEDIARKCLDNHKKAASVSQEEIFHIKQQMASPYFETNGYFPDSHKGDD